MKYKWKKILIVMSVCCFSLCTSCCGMPAEQEVRNEEVSSQTVSDKAVYVSGMPIGIYMETNGVLVLDTQDLEDANGEIVSPAKNIVKKGDYIVEVNSQFIDNKKEISEVLQNIDNSEIDMTVRRNDKQIHLKINAVKMKDGKYKLGIWIRDNVQGLGTLTYVEQNGSCGALGHGIHDTDINDLMDISKGSFYTTHISSIKKGQYGVPGSLEGFIIYNQYNKIGSIKENTECGIFGCVDVKDDFAKEENLMETAAVDEIELGPAKIRCSTGKEIEDYDVEIIAVDKSNREINKGIVFQVTDSKLIAQTGGIVQGNSGTPILQNGKIIGAVTHVFVNDPTRGYGIFIQNMIEHS